MNVPLGPIEFKFLNQRRAQVTTPTGSQTFAVLSAEIVAKGSKSSPGGKGLTLSPLRAPIHLSVLGLRSAVFVGSISSIITIICF